MTAQQWVGFAALILIVAVAIYGFRQGFKVKPDDNNRHGGDDPPPAGWASN